MVIVFGTHKFWAALELINYQVRGKCMEFFYIGICEVFRHTHRENDVIDKIKDVRCKLKWVRWWYSFACLDVTCTLRVYTHAEREKKDGTYNTRARSMLSQNICYLIAYTTETLVHSINFVSNRANNYNNVYKHLACDLITHVWPLVKSKNRKKIQSTFKIARTIFSSVNRNWNWFEWKPKAIKLEMKNQQIFGPCKWAGGDCKTNYTQNNSWIWQLMNFIWKTMTENWSNTFDVW